MMLVTAKRTTEKRDTQVFMKIVSWFPHLCAIANMWSRRDFATDLKVCCHMVIPEPRVLQSQM